MQKLAQKRRFIIDKLKEKTNVSGIAAEKFFNKDFLEVMNNLRKADNNIRSIMTGKSIEDGSVGSDAVSLKQLLKETKTNLNRREYMAAIADLGRFHYKMAEVVSEIGTLNKNVDKVHHDFLFKDLKEKGERGEDQRFEHLRQLKKRLSEQQYDFVKEAGIMDFFHNIGTRRGRALAAWEKRYPKIVQKLKDATLVMLNKSQDLFAHSLELLQIMSEARSERNVDRYVDTAGNIVKAYNKYDALFKDYYANEVKPYMDKTDMFNDPVSLPTTDGPKTVPQGPSQTVVNLTGGPQFTAELGAPAPSDNSPLGQRTPNLPVIAPNAPVPPAAPIAYGPAALPANVPAAEPTTDDVPPTNRNPGVSGQLPLITHVKFYESLKKMSGEDPIILANYINKYAKLIQANDPETSIKLFNISKSIRR